MICKKCGNRLSKKDSICIMCGEIVEGRKNGSKKIVIGILIAVIAVAAVVGFFFLRGTYVPKNGTADGKQQGREFRDIQAVAADGYLKYLNMDKADVLKDFPKAEYVGKFEGIDYYEDHIKEYTPNYTFGFDVITNKCVNVVCKITRGFPEAFQDDTDYLPKEYFESYLGMEMELMTEDESGELNTPLLFGENEMYLVFIGCDEFGIVSRYSWCDVSVKIERSIPETEEEKTEESEEQKKTESPNKSDAPKKTVKTEPVTEDGSAKESVKPKKQYNNENCFEDYTSDFNKSIDVIRSETESELHWLQTSMGYDWYVIGNKHQIGFVGTTASGEKRENDYGGKMVAVQMPITYVYEGICGYAEQIGSKEVLSFEEFKDFVSAEVNLTSTSQNKYGTPYLSYSDDGMNVIVFCDAQGNVRVGDYDYSMCIFSKK